jgi:hypothetical protein
LNIGIITAASEKYANSLFCLIGSLNCNWPTHPKILVFDLGLEANTLETLNAANIEVKKIPAFCAHWRSHYTWKLWCMANADFDLIIWMDAGMCILQELEEVIEIINNRGYFLVPNYQFLDYEVSEEACLACGVPYSYRIGKATIAGTFIGFSKYSQFGALIDEAFNISLKEENIKAYNARHKHDQSIISILTYKYFPNPELEDGIQYLGWASPRMTGGQKIWLQRRQILKEDVIIYKSNLAYTGGGMHIPKDPQKDIGIIRRLLIKLTIKLKRVVKALLAKSSKDGIR